MGSEESKSEPETKPASRRSRAWGWFRDVSVVLVLAFAGSVVFGWLRAPDLPPMAPAFTLFDLDGERVSLEDFRGQKVVLNFWATWCTPCRAEVPMVSSFARSNPNVVVLGIAVDGSERKLRQAAADLGIDYRILRATPAVVKEYGASTVPTTVFVDENGAVDSVHVGLITSPQLWFATR